MFKRIKETLLHFSSTSKSNKDYQNLINENQQLSMEVEKLKQDYLSLIDVNNELLEKLHQYQFLISEETEDTNEVKKEELSQYNNQIVEDEYNIVLHYHPGQRGKPNRQEWQQIVYIYEQVYYLSILLTSEKRTWQISLTSCMSALIPQGFRLKAVTDKGEDFEHNETVATEPGHMISLVVELEIGEGLKFEISPEPDNYVSRTFWFY